MDHAAFADRRSIAVPAGTFFIALSAGKYGIKLVFNLRHFDMPTCLMELYGGWESRHVVDLFGRFVRSAFTLFGSQVRYWTTFNEPMVIVDGSYLYDYHYPIQKNQGRKAVRVMSHIALASALAMQEYRSLQLDGRIGIILNLTPAYPRSDAREDIQTARFFDLFHGEFFMGAAVFGRLPKNLEKILKDDGVWHDLDEDDLKMIATNTADFVGANYYHPTRIQAGSHPDFESWMPDQYYEHYDLPGRRINPYKGWEIYPQAIYDIARMIQKRYRNIPWYLSESKMGVQDEGRFRAPDGMIQDDCRIDFYKEHLCWLHKAIEEGSSCFGFHAWAALDCWSWNNAYKNRYGFIEVDLDDQQRHMKKSDLWMKEASLSNGFELELEDEKPAGNLVQGGQ